MNSAISWKQFSVDNIVSGQPKSREVTTDNGSKVTAWSIPVKYRYPNGTVSDLVVDYPELTTPNGIRGKDMKTYKKYIITGALNMEDENSSLFYENFVTKLNDKCIQIIVDNYETMGFNKGAPPEDKLQKYRILAEEKYLSTFFIPTDKETKIPIEGANPLTVLNLLNFDNNKSLFTDAGKNPIVNFETNKPASFEEILDLLNGIGFSFRPRVIINKIECGVIYRAINTIKTAIVYNLSEGNNESHQDEDAEELQQKYGSSVVDGFNSKLMQIRKTKQNKQPTLSTDKSSSSSSNTTAIMDKSELLYKSDDTSSLLSTATEATEDTDTNESTTTSPEPPKFEIASKKMPTKRR
jgi:hypothetical protein